MQLCGSVSSFLWVNKEGTVHTILQAEGGEQGDPSPHACSLLPRLAPSSPGGEAQLQDGEHLFVAFLEDVYVVCSQPRVNAMYGLLQHALFAHSPIRVHHGKIQPCPASSKACGFWALRWATRSSSVPTRLVCLRNMISCWRRPAPSRIFSALGCSS